MENETCSDLYVWFEKSGVISEVRTHLRHNLINALKNRDLDLKRDSAPKSAKQYVYDLLIAEYLFNHNYAYTLSVFASEAPMLVNFPSKASEVSGSKTQDKGKLQEDYVLHSLETLGIKPQSSKGQFIISQYIQNDSPLLLCILKSLTLPFAPQSAVEEDKYVSNKYSQTEDTQDLYNEELGRLMAAKRRMLQQKKVFDCELKKREIILKEQAVTIDQQLTKLDEKFEEVQSVMKLISQKGKELEDIKQREVECLVEEQTEIHSKEKLALQEENRKLKNDLRELRMELSKLRKELSSKERQPLMKITEVQTDSVLDTVMSVKDNRIEELLKENGSLSNQVKEQQLRIEQITQRALQLSRQVEDINLLRPISNTDETPMKTVNTVISEGSSTEDILQDAKLRLRRLEEESMKADQYYYNFINATT